MQASCLRTVRPFAAMSNEQIEEFYASLSERMAAKAKLTIAPGPQTVN